LEKNFIDLHSVPTPRKKLRRSLFDSALISFCAASTVAPFSRGCKKTVRVDETYRHPPAACS